MALSRKIIFEDATRLATLTSELASIEAGESSGDGTRTRR